VATDEIIDELYGLPLSEFTQERNQAASELRRAGRGAEADQVKALRKPSVAGGEPVRQSLLAAAVDEQAARELLAGRLEHQLDPRGFGTLLAHVRPAEARPTAAPAHTKPDDRAARAKLRKAKAALTTAQANERQVRRQLARTQREVEKAQAALNKAQHDLDSLHGR
jgi:hypothetical protein